MVSNKNFTNITMSNTTLIRSFARENLLNHQGICMKSTYNYLLHLLRFIHIVFIGLHLIWRHWPSMYCTIQDRTLIGLFLISFHGECLYLCYNLIISQSYQFISLVKGFFSESAGNNSFNCGKFSFFSLYLEEGSPKSWSSKNFYHITEMGILQICWKLYKKKSFGWQS